MAARIGIQEGMFGLYGFDQIALWGLGDLNQGSSGAAVTELQDRLAAAGFPPVDGSDGQYGPNTAAAVKQFQAADGFPQTGVADQATIDQLRRVTQDQIPLPAGVTVPDLPDASSGAAPATGTSSSIANTIKNLVSGGTPAASTTAKPATAAAASTGMSTGEKIAIGAGAVVVLGGAGFLFVRSRNKRKAMLARAGKRVKLPSRRPVRAKALEGLSFW